MEPGMIALAVVGVFVLGGMLTLFVLTIRDTIRQDGRWGMNFKGLAGVDCPVCDEPMPAVRIPKNLSQMVWGGWTCPECGAEVNKWGREEGSDRRETNRKRRRPRRRAADD